MFGTTTYATYTGANRLGQQQLQKLAKDIMDFGEIKSISHFMYGTNHYSEDGSIQHFRDGGKNITVQGFGVMYHIHFYGLRVTEIIETWKGY